MLANPTTLKPITPRMGPGLHAEEDLLGGTRGAAATWLTAG